MSYENREYCIFNVSEIGLINFDQVCETSADTLRKSVDGTLTFVKWDGDEPACIANLTTVVGKYTHTEMLAIMDTEAWTVPMQMPE
jgi:hypothetical protein